MLCLTEFEELSRREKFYLIYNEYQNFNDLQNQLCELDGWERSKNKQAKKCCIAARKSILQSIENIKDILKNYLIHFFQIEYDYYNISLNVTEHKVSLYTYRKNRRIKTDYAHGHYGINFEKKEVFARPHGDDFVYRKPCECIGIHDYIHDHTYAFSESATK